jgi:hypothetical protein
VGFFDALTRANFRTTPDGGRLFFPWGEWGRGYAIASEQDYQRLRQQIITYQIVFLVLITGAASLRADVAVGLVAALSLGFYLLWMRFLQRRLHPPSERLSLQELARLRSAAGLWLREILSLVFVGSGIAILIFDPSNWSNWLFGLVTIGFFGVFAVVIARMLLLRRGNAVSSRAGES